MLKKSIPFLPVIFISLCLNAQDAPTELDKRNGFKDIKLSMPVDSVNGAKVKKEFTEKGNVQPSTVYDVEHPDYENIGEIKVRKIELKTYHDLIYEITIVTDKDPRLMKAMESVFGQASYNAKENLYFWKGKTLLLTYESNSKKELRLVYKSLTMPSIMKEDKEKKIEKIADDF